MNLLTSKQNSLPEFCRIVFIALIFVLLNTHNLFASDSLDVVWATFVGGTGWDDAQGMQVDNLGNVYLVGKTSSGDIEHKTNEPGTAYWHTFAAKLDSSGSILWTTYISGSWNSQGFDIAVNPSGDVFITGQADGEIGGNLTPGRGAGPFVTKLDGNGGAIQWTRFLKNNGGEGYAITIGGEGNLFVTGQVWGDSLYGAINEPTADSLGNINPDAFVSKLTHDGSIVWSRFIGGSAVDGGQDIFVDGLGNIYIAGGIWQGVWHGEIDSYNFPETKNVWRGGYTDGYVAKLAPSSEIIWALYVGGELLDECHGIAVDDFGDVYVSGHSGSLDINPPRTNTSAADWDGGDGFFMKINANGSVQWSTYVAVWRAGANNMVLAGCGNILGAIVNRGSGLMMLDRTMGTQLWHSGTHDFLNQEVGTETWVGVDHLLNPVFAIKSHVDFDHPKLTNSAKDGLHALVMKLKRKGIYFIFENPPPLLGWTHDGSGCWFVDNGVYEMKGKGGNSPRYTHYTAQEFYNFSLEAEASQVTGGTGDWQHGFGFYVRSDGSMNNHYGFFLNNSGGYGIVRTKNGATTTLTSGVSSETTRSECNTLKIVAQETIMEFYVNGKLLDSVTD